MGPLQNKIALITGAADGMGRAHALLMAERGADIVIADIDGDGAAVTADEVRKLGRAAHVFVVDVADVAVVQAMVAGALKEAGPIEILVNNAGIGTYASVEEIDPESFLGIFDVHLKGSFFCGQAVIPAMKQRRAGKIINISSIWGMNGADTASHYCGAKAALLGLTKAWAKELAPWNILVNAVCPGGVLTEMVTSAQSMDAIREKEKRVPIGRWARPEEISYAVAYLASSESDFVTGQMISPNGGETIVGI